MKTINAAVVPNSWVSIELRDRRCYGLDTDRLKRNERRKSRRVLNAQAAGHSYAELRKDFMSKMPPPQVVAMPHMAQQPLFLLESLPPPTCFRQVTVIRKRVSQRRPFVETLTVAV